MAPAGGMAHAGVPPGRRWRFAATKTVLIGHSNGAMLSYRMACERAGLIDGFASVAGDLFFWHPDGLGRSKMAEKAQPRLIGVGTGRNWNTVRKLAVMVGLED